MSIHQIPASNKNPRIKKYAAGPLPYIFGSKVNNIKVSYKPYPRVDNYQPTYSATGERIYSPSPRLESSKAANPYQLTKDIMINGVVLAVGSNNRIRRNPLRPTTFISLSATYPDSYIIDIPQYDQDNLAICQCVAGISQINSILKKKLSSLITNPQIDINYLLSCFPKGADIDPNINPPRPGALYDPRPHWKKDYQETAKLLETDERVCEYILGTMAQRLCFPIKVKCEEVDQKATRDRDPKICDDKTCVMRIKLTNIKIRPDTISIEDIKKQISSDKPIVATITGNDILANLQCDSYAIKNGIITYNPSSPPNYEWSDSFVCPYEAPGVGIGTHAILIIGYSQTDSHIILHCQNSWGSIPLFNILIPIDKAETILNRVIRQTKDIVNNPIFWDFDIDICYDYAFWDIGMAYPITPINPSQCCPTSTPTPTPTPTPSSPYMINLRLQNIIP